MSTIPILDCLKCNEPLTLKQTKNKECYCTKCAQELWWEREQERRTDLIHNANKVFK